jgi:hypothetical protein
VLSQRLRELEQAGVVRRDQLPPPAASRVYELTDWGRELEPVVLGLGRWGSRAPFPAAHGPLGVDALMLALKTLYDPLLAGRQIGSIYELHLAGQPFAVRPTERQLEVSRGAAREPVATIATDPEELQAVLWHGRARRAARLTISGDQRAAERFLGLFPLPAR